MRLSSKRELTISNLRGRSPFWWFCSSRTQLAQPREPWRVPVRYSHECMSASRKRLYNSTGILRCKCMNQDQDMVVPVPLPCTNNLQSTSRVCSSLCTSYHRATKELSRLQNAKWIQNDAFWLEVAPTKSLKIFTPWTQLCHKFGFM